MTYVDLLKTDAAEMYNQEMLMFALGGLKKPPSLPRILKDG